MLNITFKFSLLTINVKQQDNFYYQNAEFVDFGHSCILVNSIWLNLISFVDCMTSASPTDDYLCCVCQSVIGHEESSTNKPSRLELNQTKSSKAKFAPKLLKRQHWARADKRRYVEIKDRNFKYYLVILVKYFIFDGKVKMYYQWKNTLCQCKTKKVYIKKVFNFVKFIFDFTIRNIL